MKDDRMNPAIVVIVVSIVFIIMICCDFAVKYYSKKWAIKNAVIESVEVINGNTN